MSETILLPPAVSFWAGTFGSMVGMVVGQPLDTIKVRQQSLSYKNVFDCAIKTVKNEGPLALFKGLVPPVISGGLLSCIPFYVYELGKQYFQKRTLKLSGKLNEPTLFQLGVSAGFAGWVQIFFFAPFEVVKVQLQVQKTEKFYSGPIDCAIKVYKQSGLFRGLYKGYWLMVAMGVPGWAVYFWSYEAFRRLFLTESSHLSILISGGMAGSLSWLVAYPLDVVKSRFQTDRLGRYKNTTDCILQTWNELGMNIWTKGLAATMVRAFIVNATTFYTYEWLKKMYAKYLHK